MSDSDRLTSSMFIMVSHRRFLHSQATFSFSLAKYDTMHKQIFDGLTMSCHLCLAEQVLNAEANCSLINMYNAISV